MAQRPVTLRDIASGHVSLEIEGFGRLYFNGWVPAPQSWRQAIGFVEACGRARSVQYPFQGTIATTDGVTLWVFRYSSQGKSRSLFVTRDVRALRQQYPDREILREVSDDTRLVVSEPIGDLPGAWIEMPEASYGIVSKRDGQLLPFAPKPPPKTA